MNYVASRPCGLQRRLVSSAIIFIGTIFCTTTSAHTQSCPLGSAYKFAVLGSSAVTNTNATIIVGDLGISPGTSITGQSGITMTGSVYQTDAVAALAQTDVNTQYQVLEGLPFTQELTGQNLGALILTPGVYRFASSALLTGTLTLNTLGDPNAQFVFQIGSTLTTASNSVVTVIGGPDKNIFWQIGSSATLGTGTRFAGNILAQSSITMNTGATIQCGAALAQNGAVTLDNNLIISCTPTACNAVTVPGGGTGSGTPTPIAGGGGTGGTPAIPIPANCVAIDASSAVTASATQIYNRARVINMRVKLFAQRADVCGDESFSLTQADELLEEIQSALMTSFTTSVINCPDSVCQSIETKESKNTIRQLARRLYLLQVKTKLGAIAACPVNRAPQIANRRDSKYYFNRVISAIKSLPVRQFTCD